MALAASPNFRKAARRIARKYGIDENIFSRQIQQESGFNPRARSAAGALGIAQIVPQWHPGVDPWKPLEALNYAAKHDATLLQKYGGDWRKVLSVYNSGNPDLKYAETRNYVNAILGGQATEGASPLTGLAEAFYDPLGSYDNSAFGGPIGGHDTHVHLSVTNPQSMLTAIQYAKTLGMNVTENPYVGSVDPDVHVGGSFHYRNFPGQFGGRTLGEGIDVTGTPEQMAQLYRWATSSGAQNAGVQAGQPSMVPFEPSVVYQGISTAAAVPKASKLKASKKVAVPNNAFQKQLIALMKQAMTQKTLPPSAYGKTATQYANEAIAAQTSPLIAAQAQARADAAARAVEITRASQAAAEFLKGLGDKTQADASATFNAQQGMAQGYSGLLRDVASEQARRDQELLSSVPGNTQTAEDHSTNLQQLLFGMSGSIPGNVLLSQGLAATTSARALPFKELAYGETQASAARGQGEADAREFDLPLQQAAAQFPTLQRQYMQDLYESATKSQQAKITNAINLAKLYKAAGDATGATTKLQIKTRADGSTYTFNPTTGETRDVSGAIAKPPRITWNSYGGFAIDSAGTVTQFAGPQTKPNKRTTFSIPNVGRMWYDPTTGESGIVPGSKPGKPPPKGTDKDRENKRAVKLSEDVEKWFAVVPPKTYWDPKQRKRVPEEGTGRPRVKYQDAIRRALKRVPSTPKWRQRAIDIVNSYYYSEEAVALAREAYNSWNDLRGTPEAIPMIDAINLMLDEGIPPDIVASVFGVPARGRLAALPR